MAAQIANANAMVASSVNHPSVFCWGVFNEGHSHEPACRDGYAKLLGHLRELDPTRPVTYACNHPHDDVCLDLADFIAINCYPGWYHGTIEEIPHHLDRIVASLAEKGQGDKPLIFSEIGAGAIYGWRDWNETRWTEQYQAKLLEMVIRTMFMDRSDICGLSIWQFCDIRTAQDPNRAIKRPRAFNNKGVLDEYRRPKPAYDVVKRLFAELGK
jgi:beta-glucuronidase